MITTGIKCKETYIMPHVRKAESKPGHHYCASVWFILEKIWPNTGEAHLSILPWQ